MELTNEFAKAVLCAYTALVNRLSQSKAVDKEELISALSSFSELLAENGHSAESSQYLKAFATSLSGDEPGVQESLRLLH